MQRLEVSGAVRPIYGSLGVKRLINSPATTLHFQAYSTCTELPVGAASATVHFLLRFVQSVVQ